MTTLLQQFAIKLDKKLDHYPTLKHSLCLFFDWSSWFTSLLLFNKFLFTAMLIIIYSITIYHGGELHLFIIAVSKGGIGGLYFDWVHLLSPKLRYTLLFCIFLLQITCFNTFISMFPGIRSYMFQLYGNSIIKERGYNAPTASIQRAVIACATCIIGAVGAEISNRGAYSDTLEVYKETYKQYLEKVTSQAQPPQVPPYQPVAAKVFETMKD